MKGALVFCSIIAFASSKPGGFYHQESNYKSSFSSYKNNELQHQKDDQGFYSKDGDIDGILKPKVNSQSAHSEYVNPKLLSGSSSHQGSGGYSSGSNGNYLTSSDRLFGTNLNGYQSGGAVDGYASSDRILDLSNVYASGSHQSSREGYGTSQGGYGTSMGGYGSSMRGHGTHQSTYDTTGGYGSLNGGNYGDSLGTSNIGYSQGGSVYGYVQRGNSFGTSGTYATNANLDSLAQRLQDDLSQQLQSAIHNQYRSSGYTTSVSNTQMTADIRTLEDELKRNLTRQLQESLRSQYGQQELRGTNLYSVSQGRPSSVINYNNQELTDLTRRLEDNLIKKLHENVRTTYSRGYTSNNMYQPTYTSRPYYERPVPSNIRYTPIPNPESITTIASKTQTNINSYVDTALHNLYSTYLQSGRNTYYTLTDFDNEVNRIKEEIIRNLTLSMDDEIRKNYGHQVLKGDYYYSVSTNGETSTQHNYNMKDYDDLRKQIELNLLKKLNQTVSTYRDQYQRQQTYSSNSVTFRPVYYTSGSQVYDYSDLQRQLTQQLQNALNRRTYSTSSISSNPQAYQMSLDELSRELQRNLTEQLNSYKASSSGSGYGYTSGGSADFESMKNQLQTQLMQQLQQGLQKQYSYSASASYSASSSSSNYGGHQSYGSHGNYDPASHSHGRYKRNAGRVQRGHRRHYASQQEIVSDQELTGELLCGVTDRLEPVDGNLKHLPRIVHETEPYFGDQETGDDLTQKLEFQDQQTGQFEEANSHLQQLEFSSNKKLKYTEDQDGLTQQLELTKEPTPKVSDSQEQNDITQQLETEVPPPKRAYTLQENQERPDKVDQDQQLEDLSQHQQELENLSQQLELEDARKPKVKHTRPLTQQLEDDATHLLELSRNQHPADQQDDFTQQLEIARIPKNKHEHYRDQYQQSVEQSQDDFTQQLEVTDAHKKPTYYQEQELTGQLESQSVVQKLDLTQQLEVEPKSTKLQELEDQNDLTQQLELEPKPNTHKLQLQPVEQELENQNDLTQQLELEPKPNTHKLQLQSVEQELENQNDLTQQLELEPKTNTHKLQLQSVGQELEDLPQQLELEKKLESQSIGQQLEDQNDFTQQLELEPKVNSKKLLPLESQSVVQQLEDLTQQLELEHKPSSKKLHQQPVVQQLEDQNDLSQQLELESKPNLNKLKPQSVLQQFEDQDDFTQQLELDPKKRHQQQQLKNQNDFSQQLELESNPKSKKLVPQSIEQHLEDQNDLTQLELESKVNSKKVQSLESQTVIKVEKKPGYSQDLTQQLEVTHYTKPKPQQVNLGQQLENQDDFDQQLEPTGVRQHNHQESIGQLEIDTPSHEFEQQTHAPKGILEQHPENQQLENNFQLTNQLQHQKIQEKDFTQQLETNDLQQQKDTHQLQEQLTQQLGLIKEPIHIQKELKQLEGQQEQDFAQQLEFTDIQTTKKANHAKTAVEQELEYNTLDQKLELLHTTEGIPEHTGYEQRENDLRELKLTKVPKPNYHEIQPIEDLIQHTESSDSQAIKKNRDQLTLTDITNKKQVGHVGQQYGHNFGQNVLTNEEFNSEHRSFTNGHSGYTAPDIRTSKVTTTSDSYDAALRKQDALLDLLKQRVQSQNHAIYGQSTIKKTVYVNGKPVSSSENTQFIGPDGTIISNQPSYSGNNLRRTSYISENPTAQFVTPDGKIINANPPLDPTSYSGHSLTYPSNGPPQSHWQFEGKSSDSYHSGMNHLHGTRTEIPVSGPVYPEYRELDGSMVSNSRYTSPSGNTLRRTSYISENPTSQFVGPNGELINANRPASYSGHTLPYTSNDHPQSHWQFGGKSSSETFDSYHSGMNHLHGTRTEIPVSRPITKQVVGIVNGRPVYAESRGPNLPFTSPTYSGNNLQRTGYISKNTESQFETTNGKMINTNPPLGSTSYSGHKSTYTSPSQHHWQFGGKSSSETFDSELNHLQGTRTEIPVSRQTTKHIVDIVNGRPIYAESREHFPSEFTPIEDNHRIQTSQVSAQTQRRTTHYVNGKLVSSSETTQRLNPDGTVVQITKDSHLTPNKIQKQVSQQLEPNERHLSEGPLKTSGYSGTKGY